MPLMHNRRDFVTSLSMAGAAAAVSEFFEPNASVDSRELGPIPLTAIVGHVNCTPVSSTDQSAASSDEIASTSIA